MQNQVITTASSTIFVLFLTFLLNHNIDGTQAWTFIGQFQNDSHPGKCCFEDGLIVAPGEIVQSPSKCIRYYCTNSSGWGGGYGCGAIGTLPNCKWGDPINVQAPYPKCCDRHLLCEEEQRTTLEVEQKFKKPVEKVTLRDDKSLETTTEIPVPLDLDQEDDISSTPNIADNLV